MVFVLKSQSSLKKMVLCTISLMLAVQVHAQLPPGLGRIEEARQARASAGQCPDGSGFSSTSDESVSSQILGNVTACLRREGILAQRNITVSAINSFERGCQFAPRSQPLVMGSFSNRLMTDQFFQDLASRSQAQVNCRIDFFNNYFNGDAARKSSFQRRVSQLYEGLRGELEPLVAYKDDLERTVLMAEASAGGDCGAPPYNTGADCIEAAQNGGYARGTLINVNKRIASLCVRLPVGYEPEMCEAIMEMARVGSYNAAAIEQGLRRSQEKYTAAANTYTRNSIPTQSGHGYYCLTDRYRNLALSSGQAESLLASYPANVMDDTTKKVLRCQLRSEYLVSQSRLNWGIGGVIALGAIATAIPTGGGSVGTALAVTGAVAGVVGVVSQLDQALQSCTRYASSETDIISGASRTCNAEADYSHALEESSLSSCLTNSGLAVVAAVTIPANFTAIANARRVANPLIRAESTADNLVADAASAEAAAADAGQDIVVTARTSGRSSRGSRGGSNGRASRSSASASANAASGRARAATREADTAAGRATADTGADVAAANGTRIERIIAESGENSTELNGLVRELQAAGATRQEIREAMEAALRQCIIPGR